MISVIIPALNEASAIEATLSRARKGLSPDSEIIVVDGGSTDDTRRIAEQCGARVIDSPRGRGIQMNAGAREARGDILLFLHADTLLPDGAGGAVSAACANAAVIAGNFQLTFAPSSGIARVFERIYNLRSRSQRLFYGDSAIWVRRAAFESLGGYREDYLMEDYRLCLALRAEAIRIHPSLPLTQTLPMLPGPVMTSSRRFHGKQGLAFRMAATWCLLHTLYRLGAKPERLERRFYPPVGR